MKLPHASLLIGDEQSAQKHINSLVKDFGMPVEIHTRTFASLGIDDVRDIKSLHSETRKSEDGARFICVPALTFTLPAQNALLKMTEEPNEGTYLFFSTPRSEELLPTLISRCRMIPLVRHTGLFQAEAESFFTGSMTERLLIVSDVHKQIDGADESAQARDILHSFLSALEGAYEKRLETDSVKSEFGKKLYSVKSWASNTGTSAKQMLEFLALSL